MRQSQRILTAVLPVLFIAACAPAAAPAPAEAPGEPQPQMMEGMRDDPGMHRAMSLVVQLLDDSEVQHRIRAVPEYHEAWEDPAVQRHIDHMREMHGEHAAHERGEHAQHRMGEMRDDPGMHRAMSLVVQLLDDPEVQRRIRAVPEYDEAWGDPAVQQHIDHMRGMHGDNHHDHR